MVALLKDAYHAGYHEGLDLVGQCFGATTTRKTEQGAPDVVWSFANDLHIAFEAKTEKKTSSDLAKKDVTEAKGHIDWVRDRLCQDPEKAEIQVVVVAPTPTLHQVALPFAGGLFYLAPDRISKLAGKTVESMRKLRVQFGGREFAEAAIEFSAAMRNMGLDLESAKKMLLTEHLKK
jgi:hypothetical protein